MQIWCPGCEWKPRPWSLWMCEWTCRHQWNTFDTGGVCPACSKVWKETQCLACHRRYPHGDWYHDDPTADSTETGDEVTEDDWAAWERELDEPSREPAGSAPTPAPVRVASTA